MSRLFRMQPPCPNCHAAALERVKRSFIERVVYRRVMACAKCGYRRRDWRIPFEAVLTFVFSTHTRCIQCGSLRVRRLPRRDVIDPMSAHPMSILGGLLRAPIYHCSPCRLQYRDWRPIDPAGMREHAAAPSSDAV